MVDVSVPAEINLNPSSTYAALLIIDERGADLEFRLNPTAAFEAINVRPPRQGQLALWIDAPTRIELRAVQPASQPIRLTWRCAPSIAEAALPACLKRAANVATTKRIDWQNLEVTPACQAFFAHAQAQAASNAEDAEASLRLYQDAVRRWDALGDSSRAASAKLGVVEQAIRLKRLDFALEAADQAELSARAAGQSRLALRAKMEFCLATHYSGRVPEGIGCMESVASAFFAIDEPNDAATAVYNAVEMLRAAGLNDRARTLLESVQGRFGNTLTPMARARLHDAAAAVAMDRGAIDEALAQSRKAMVAYEQVGNQRALGQAMLSQGQTWQALNKNEEAQLYWREAELRFRQINAPDRASAARLLLAQAVLSSLDTPITGPLKRPLFQSEVQTQAGLIAAHVIDRDFDSARRESLQLNQRLRTLAHGFGRPVIGTMALTQLSDLRSALLNQGTAFSVMPPDQLWTLLLASDEQLPAPQLWSQASWAGNGFRGSIALTQAQLDRPALDGPALMNAHRSILETLLEGTPQTAGAADLPLDALPSLDAIRQRLDADAQIIWLAGGTQQSLMLSVTRDTAEVFKIASLVTIRAQLDPLIAALNTPQASVDALLLQSAQLSKSVLPAALKAPAKQLYFIVDRSLAELPLAMLRWPNTEGWLIEHSSVSRLVSLNQTASAPSRSNPIDAFVAAIVTSEQLKLPPLASAEYEPEWIQSALPGAKVKAIRGPQFDRSALLQSLRRSGQWVHVAAHGSVPSGLNGFAGLWLNDEHNQPQYLSWIDLVSEPLAAELAVFNACEIGASASATSRGNQGFARMLSTAGVRHVVAASWPISDAAAGLWVPTFYQALAPPNGSENTPRALQLAQQSLLTSRRFRHPYWWAGLIHYASELPSP